MQIGPIINKLHAQQIKRWRDSFRAQANHLDGKEVAGVHPRLVQAQVEALRSTADEMDAALTEWETRRSKP